MLQVLYMQAWGYGKNRSRKDKKGEQKCKRQMH